jgi:homoserine dehydrogenase
VQADVILLGTGVVGSAFIAAPKKHVNVVRSVNTRTWPVYDDELDRLAKCATPVIVDATPADGLESLYARALSRGIHVVTANKKPLASTYAVRRELFAIAERAGATIGRDATVGAGLPFIRTIGDLVSTGDRVRRIECVLSGTLSFLCEELHRGTKLEDAIATAKARGYTEPDPAVDLSGVDVARKAVILARELGFALELEDVDLEPFRALAAGPDEGPDERLVYLACIDVDDERGHARASARPVVVPLSHPAANVRGPVALAAFTTDRYTDEPLVIRGPGAGGAVTASALLGDIARIGATGTRRAGIQGSCVKRSASVASSASSSSSTRAGS